jgi:predicted transposase
MPESRPPKLFQGVQARLVFLKKEDERAVLDLMRRFSSMVRLAYQRLLEERDRKEFKREDSLLCTLFGLNTRYANWKELSWCQSLEGPEGRPTPSSSWT